MCTRKYYYYHKGGARGLSKLGLLIGKLQRRFSLLATAREEGDDCSDFEDEEFEVPTTSHSVPDDVKEGHFAVLAVTGSEKKRFIVRLECLSSPAFLRLLEQAEEEYGFHQTGAISVPCPPEEFMKIL